MLVDHPPLTGVDLIRRFPSLESLILKVKYLCLTAKDTPSKVICKLQAIVKIILAEFELERQRNPS